MALYEKYPDEAHFRDEFVKPLLNRLGFYGVDQQHGTSEFGKDFVFSELHRLGGMRHYAAPVKHERRINQGKLVDELLTQIRQCFSVPFTRSDSPRSCHVSSVYVFNSGEITDNAKTYMLSALAGEHYGDNVHFLDGARLESLAQWVIPAHDRDVRARMLGLRRQLDFNQQIARSYQACKIEMVDGVVHTVTETRGFMLGGIEAYLSSPISEAAVPEDDIYNLWCLCRVVDAHAGALNSHDPHAVKRAVESMRPVLPLVLETITRIRAAVDAALARLRPLM
jgi:hypothetical protein